MRDVKLYGHLGKKFGKLFRMNVKSPAEAVASLRANLPGFEQALISHAPGYRVFIGNGDISAKELMVKSDRDVEIRIVPIVAGAGGGGIGQIIFGGALVFAGVMFSQPWMVNIGTSLILGGISQMLTKPPKSPGSTERSKNYSFNGPVNTTGQGNPVPIVYGRMVVGSQVISAGLSTEKIVTVPPQGNGTFSGSISTNGAIA